MSSMKEDEKKQLVVHVPVKGVEERLEKLSSSLDTYLGADDDMRGMMRDVFRELQALSAQMTQMQKQINTITEKTDGVSSHIQSMEQNVATTGKNMGLLTKHFQVAHVDACPECGSSVAYTVTMGGEMGACNVCGWSHFLDS